jgi:hypothetical protein
MRRRDRYEQTAGDQQADAATGATIPMATVPPFAGPAVVAWR